jgi:hypothetical protein
MKNAGITITVLAANTAQRLCLLGGATEPVPFCRCQAYSIRDFIAVAGVNSLIGRVDVNLFDDKYSTVVGFPDYGFQAFAGMEHRL